MISVIFTRLRKLKVTTLINFAIFLYPNVCDFLTTILENANDDLKKITLAKMLEQKQNFYFLPIKY